MLNGTILNGVEPVRSQTGAQCEVCGKPVNYPHLLKIKNLNYTVCQSFDCQRMMSKKSLMNPQLFTVQLEFNKKLIRQRSEKLKQRKQ
jgi:ribosome-binding protein aMBF1 (putative translation factor)